MEDTNIIEKDKQNNIPQNVVFPACCEKKPDRVLAYTLPDDGQRLDSGIM